MQLCFEQITLLGDNHEFHNKHLTKISKTYMHALHHLYIIIYKK